MARRKAFAPQVMAYWLSSASMAAFAASFSSAGQGKSGKPCARLMPSCARQSRVISRITDSVNVPAFADTRNGPPAGRAWPPPGSRASCNMIGDTAGDTAEGAVFGWPALARSVTKPSWPSSRRPTGQRAGPGRSSAETAGGAATGNRCHSHDPYDSPWARM